MKQSMAEIERHLKRLKNELDNFEEIAVKIKPDPGDVPVLPGIEIAGEMIPLNGQVGGDHIAYVDFNRRYDLDARVAEAKKAGRKEVAATLARNKTRAGVLVADAAGHQLTDAALAAMLHQAFLVGVLYELDMFGTVTTRLFEHINTRFYHTSSVNKYITMIYGEISVDGRFRFINAGHPFPLVFSNEFNRLVRVAEGHPETFPPIGTMPSRDDVDYRQHTSPLGRKSRYVINDISLMGIGDVLLLFTDGFYDHGEEGPGRFGETVLEPLLRDLKNRTAQEIVAELKSAIRSHAPQDDDISYVVIRRVQS